MKFVGKTTEQVLVLTEAEIKSFREVFKLVWPDLDVGDIQVMELRTTKMCCVAFRIEVVP